MSPAATLTINDASRAVLLAANELFYANGINGVVMSDIRDASGVSMRRLYNMYPSKSALVAAWLTDRHDTWMAWFTTSVERHVAAGADPVMATFDAIAEWVSAPGYRGCAFINSLAETNEIDDSHRSIIAAHKRDLIEHLANLAARAHPSAPRWLPAALAVIIDGAIVQCTVFGSTEPLDAARSAVSQLLKTIPT
ncbi:MAG: TetR/AcrR family transcriptional regulator [Actinomycetia bacterium]|nr:TetR/AcrR family transcriptional regulator [Actinomycetes bacterium]